MQTVSYRAPFAVVALLAAALVALSGCAEIAKIPSKVDSLGLPRAPGDSSYQIIARLPGLESVAPARDRRSSGYQQFVETAKWKSAELTLVRTSHTGRRFIVRSGVGSLEQVILNRFGNRARDFDPLDARGHAIGQVEYQQFRLNPRQRCLAFRAFDGTPPQEGFVGGIGIHESLGRAVLQGWYCKRGSKAFDGRTVRQIMDSVSVQGF